MSINENIGNNRKIADTKLLISQLLMFPQITKLRQSFYPVVQYAHDLILIFMKLMSIRNYRKITEKLNGYTNKIINILAAYCPRVENIIPK